MDDCLFCKIVAGEIPAEIVYDCWLDPLVQGAICEAVAAIHPVAEGQYRLWGGAVIGKFIALERPKKIVQTWLRSKTASA